MNNIGTMTSWLFSTFIGHGLVDKGFIMRSRETGVIAFAVILVVTGCAQVPKSYTWEMVDCHYQRGVEGLEATQVKAKCELEGRVELTRPGLPF